MQFICKFIFKEQWFSKNKFLQFSFLAIVKFFSAIIEISLVQKQYRLWSLGHLTIPILMCLKVCLVHTACLALFIVFILKCHCLILVRFTSYGFGFRCPRNPLTFLQQPPSFSCCCESLR